MKKRIIPFALVLVLVLGITAHAVEPRLTKVVPSLTFEGTTANCSVSISTDFGSKIEATITLYDGNRVVDSWSGEGTSMLLVKGDCVVTKGKSYTLKATGTIDGVAFDVATVSGTC